MPAAFCSQAKQLGRVFAASWFGDVWNLSGGTRPSAALPFVTDWRISAFGGWQRQSPHRCRACMPNNMERTHVAARHGNTNTHQTHTKHNAASRKADSPPAYWAHRPTGPTVQATPATPASVRPRPSSCTGRPGPNQWQSPPPSQQQPGRRRPGQSGGSRWAR